MDYRNFEIEDFARDDSFLKWVLDRDPEAGRFWVNLMVQYPELKQKIELARTLALDIKKAEQTHFSQGRTESLWKRIDGNLKPSTRLDPAQKYYAALKIAATVSILMLVYFGVPNLLQVVSETGGVEAPQPIAGDFIEEVNTSGDMLKIHLSDGTTVSLHHASRLRYPVSFSRHENREVYLTGEGFFEVARNSQQPFLVHTNDITTKVLGTSFRVKAYTHEKDIVVAVKEGKVSVFSSRESDNKKSRILEAEVNGVVLTPNQQVIYSLSENSFNKTLVEEPEKVVADNAGVDFTFENAPVREVFEALELAYGVEIIFDEEVMQNCFLTVPLGDEPLFEKVRIICRTIGASYELIDASLVVTSKGC